MVKCKVLFLCVVSVFVNIWTLYGDLKFGLFRALIEAPILLFQNATLTLFTWYQNRCSPDFGRIPVFLVCSSFSLHEKESILFLVLILFGDHEDSHWRSIAVLYCRFISWSVPCIFVTWSVVDAFNLCNVFFHHGVNRSVVES